MPLQQRSEKRERRPWTIDEDLLLRQGVETEEEPGTSAPSKWNAIAEHVPGRTNKDCRKRWYSKMNAEVLRGGWSDEEDARLVAAIEKYGTRWSLVATMVQTRNSDQCAKRWTDTLDPTIDHGAWSKSHDNLLLQAVNTQGKLWTKIVKKHFPGRTGLAAKNRRVSLLRYNALLREPTSFKRRPRQRHPRSSRSNSISSCAESSASSVGTGSPAAFAPLELDGFFAEAFDPSQFFPPPTAWPGSPDAHLAGGQPTSSYAGSASHHLPSGESSLSFTPSFPPEPHDLHLSDPMHALYAADFATVPTPALLPSDFNTQLLATPSDAEALAARGNPSLDVDQPISHPAPGVAGYEYPPPATGAVYPTSWDAGAMWDAMVALPPGGFRWPERFGHIEGE
ncbi:hypothetical protein MIND_01428600 [Mycena indigotica]|uniref:Uncharacterized protein n=1 Tax=Mycena indigotica TaxID=2126181 RepID=A0A8H6RVK2_9AGAR|nr:uncharacterized protein MIND_01428600 [Mycena indigotica]KAF7288620.1 hypothetical protein MIND_01428600 [Mycena indigotica]